ncbi:sodium-dependent phosphate transport protein 1 [Ochotona princeps]|uniref:sodium-dependent phosphate transport protein 1 n=1 Tax=Ochotona princeps TaxID=9978 RepID=UPI002715521D|nr:sodium-dependent phosphate transport protein 1 [Ochotona princeps]
MDNQFPSKKGPSFCSFRYVLALFMHSCNVVVMAQRMCLSLTMIAMVNNTNLRGLPNTSTEDHPGYIKNPVYDWSPDIQGIILSAILYGTFIIQIPVGYLSGIYPIKKIIGFALLLSSLFSLFIPLAAEVGETWIIACRVLQGISQGTATTAQHEIWVKWAPPLERSSLTSISLSGFLLGPFIVLLVTGIICDSLGWPMVFYIFGACGCTLSLLWFILFYDDPKNHPCVSINEKEYITSSLIQQVSSTRPSLPIMAIIKSLPLWAISFSSFAYLWTYNILILYSPTFINSMLHVNIRENGILSSLPFLLAWICGIIAGHAADLLSSKNVLSLTAVRKLFTAMGLLLPSIFSMCLLYLSYSFSSTIAFLILANATSSLCLAGTLINALDIAPRYYAFLKGVTAVIGMTGGIISSTLTGLFLSQDPESSWFKIFLLMSAINVISLIFYLIFAKAEIQDWAKEKQHTQF